MHNVKPIPRHLLAKFLSDPETIRAFEKIVDNAGQLIPDELNAVNFAAENAAAHATAVGGILEVLEGALSLLAAAPLAEPAPDDGDVSGTSTQDMDELFAAAPEEPYPETQPYGGMYSNTPTVVAVAAAGTAYELTAGATAGLVFLVTFGGAHYLQVERGGVFLVEWSMSVAAGAGDDVEGGIMIDGVAQAAGRADGNMGAAGSKHELSGQAYIKLSPLQQVSLFVINQTAAVNISVDHMSCTISLKDRRVS